MGVLMPSSCLMKSAKRAKGLRAERDESSEGNVEVIGVLSWGSFGLVVVAAMMGCLLSWDQMNDSGSTEELMTGRP